MRIFRIALVATMLAGVAGVTSLAVPSGTQAAEADDQCTYVIGVSGMT